MNRAFFSVILPTHNRRALLQRAVESVIAQQCQDWELIVVNDGSTDDTVDYLNGLSEDRLKVISIKHQERSVARNIGIDASQGKYICFLDDDDYYLPAYLSTFAAELVGHESDRIILRTGFIIKNGSQEDKSVLHSAAAQHPVPFFSHEMCGVWSLCVPRACFDTHRFHEAYPHWQDSHLIFRLLSVYDMKQIEAWTYIYVQHDRMGSKELFRNREIVERTDLQIEAINDLFMNHDPVINKYLGLNDRRRLIAEKRIRAAVLLHEERQFRSAWQEVSKADWSTDLWASYIRIGLTLCVSSVRRLWQIVTSHMSQTIKRALATGHGVECPCCRHQFKSFSDYGIHSRHNARCWHCNALERHRLLHLYLDQETHLFQPLTTQKLLHFGPSEVMYDRFIQLSNLSYTAVDLHPSDYLMHLQKMDMTDIGGPDGTYDYILAIHIMEHIKDDIAAMKELYRVLKPGARAILMIPIDLKIEKTIESDVSLSGDEHELLYGQTDHVRLYGQDFIDRLVKVGFNVEACRYAAALSDAEIERYAVFKDELIFVCSKV